MSQAAYKRLEATATRLINKWGKAGTLWRETTSGPAHDPVVTETDYAITLVETGYSLTNRDESLVQAGDKLGLIATDGEAQPQMSDQIEIGGTKYNFVDVKPLNPGGRVLLHEFHARK